MKNLRIGNDIVVTWSLMREGEPYPISGYKVKLYLCSPFDRDEITDFTVSDNIIRWTFYGKDQKNIGKHSLVLVVNEGEPGMVTTDSRNFVNLVACSCNAGTDDENITTETIELTSAVDLAPVVIQGEGGSGLKYSEERTAYITKMDFFGDFEETFEITEEQREYNKETTRLAFENAVTLNVGGVLLYPMVGQMVGTEFGAVIGDETEMWCYSVFVDENGNAEAAFKVIPISGGGSVDPELLEGYMPLAREFSDDFNNDFAR